MAAAKGNKHALGCTTSGRPNRFDLQEEAKLLSEWAEKDSTLVLREFAALRNYSAQSKLNEYADQCNEFREAFNKAKILIGARREKLLMKGIGNATPFNRYAALYDPELKAHDIEMKQKEAEQLKPLQIIVRGPAPGECLDH